MLTFKFVFTVAYKIDSQFPHDPVLDKRDLDDCHSLKVLATSVPVTVNGESTSYITYEGEFYRDYALFEHGLPIGHFLLNSGRV
jgi:hypothetical protein